MTKQLIRFRGALPLVSVGQHSWQFLNLNPKGRKAKSMTSVLIAEDHPVVRAGYRAFLTAIGRITDWGEASTAAEVLRQLRARAWDVIMLDIHLPDKTGIGLLQDIGREFPEARVLVVSGLPEDPYAIEVLRAGALGYLSKDCAPSELVSAVHRVLGGQRYISKRVAELMAENLRKPTVPLHEKLSKRERQVFDRLALGRTNTGIALELQLSIKTISTYKSRIMDKMALKTAAAMTSYALRHGLTGGTAYPAEHEAPGSQQP